MPHAWIEDRARSAEYQKAVERARAAGRTPPARYRVRWTDEIGNRRSWSVPTRRLAMALAVDLAESRAPITLNRLVDHWSAAKPVHYRRSLDLHVLPRLGSRLAITITRADIERWLLALCAEGRLVAATINKILATLKRALEFGVRCGHLPHNPALGIRPLPRPTT